jgi:Outer membrane protein beta-barrel family
MPKLPILLLLSLLLSSAALAQSSAISGKITDTSERKNLPGSSVLLLRKTDSILIRHTRAGGSGDFRLNNIPTGKYILLVTYPKYADYVDELDVKDSTPIILPDIGLVLKSKLLEAVVVNGARAIRLKGDTTEFNADSFRTEAGASVEDLLKKLPGIQVDHNGKITAQGQTVKKVLVDGEEFFGDDPTLVTQNLRADMVDKVQLYDKKSDQSNFTGIDDGQREKTINLKLKDGKKNGYFGRLSGGAGTDGYYDAQAMVNYFRKKEKLAAYGIVSNTGKTGLNWQDRDNYGQSFADNLDVDQNTGDLSWSGPAGNDLDTWNGQYSGQGFPTVRTGGLHYNNKWNNDFQSANGNYQYMDLSVNGNSATNTETILPDSLFYNNQTQKFNNQIIRHSFSGTYEVKFDSTSSLKLLADGGMDHKTTNELDNSDYLASDSSKVNQNTRSLSSVGDNRIVNSNLLWRKKLSGKGRTLSFNLRENYSDKTSTGYLYSNTQFYSGGLPANDSIVDQYKSYHTENTLVDAKLVYTEPLGKGSFLAADYGATINNSHSNQNSYNKSPVGKYSDLDSLYSSDYQYNIFTQKGGLAYNLVKKKFRFNAGNDIGFASYDQHDLHADTSVRRNFVNWYPHASAGYNFTSQQRLSFYYYGNTSQPTLQQLQPILTNEDPLNITIGNPGLKPQFANRFSANYNDYKILTERGIYASASYTVTQNAIGSSVNVDTTGKRTTQYVNVNGNYTFDGYASYGFKWKKPDLFVEFHTGVNQNRSVSIVNDLPNATKSGTYSLGFDLGKSKEKKYSFSVSYSASYTTSLSSINTGVTTHYFTHQIRPFLDIFLPLRFQIHADGDINLRQKTSAFDNNNNVVLLNAWFGKKFLKKDALLLKVSGNDLLNQNNGFNRTVSSNFITQNTYSTIKRYFMFSVVWNFTKAGTSAPGQGN